MEEKDGKFSFGGRAESLFLTEDNPLSSGIRGTPARPAKRTKTLFRPEVNGVFAVFVSFCLRTHPRHPRFLIFKTFPRYLAPDFTHYISERPEITSHDENYRRPNKKKKKETITMKTTLTKTIMRSLAFTCALGCLVAAIALGTSGVASAQAPERTIQGVWRTMVTGVNCQTGDPLGPPFPGLFTFNKDGTMSEYGIGPGSSPACVAPATEFGSTRQFGRITRTRSRTIAMTRAAFLSDRRKLRLPWNSAKAAMSLQRTLQSKFSMPTAT